MSASRALAGTGNKAVRNRVIADLNEGMRLGAFAWHRPISDSELTGHQLAVFRTADLEQDENFLIDERKFDHERVDRYLPLGGVEEWRLSVPPKSGRHQFHIHVNPFQIISISSAKGEDVTDPKGPGYDPDFAGVKGQWRDNVLLKSGNTVVMRTRYERFIGDFMLHCHILKHGDEGMAQYLRIYVPGNPQGPHKHH
jgi:FtsP/CotA-like multicopper oxidase with cupredoxin domain